MAVREPLDDSRQDISLLREDGPLPKWSDAEAALNEKEALAADTSFAAEYQVSTSKKLAYLAFYFMCNVSLTIYNKLVLGKFSYPWMLTAIHAGSASLGCYLLMLSGTFRLSQLSSRQQWVIVAFSVLFTVNIAASNVSLAMVSVPFHQIMRSTTPVFTVLIYRLRYDRSYSTKTYLSLIPLVLGVGLSTYGDYYFTMMGFVMTMVGVILGAVKTVATNRIMTGPLALSPMESLLRLSPLACIQALLIALLTGEVSSFYSQYAPSPVPMVDDTMDTTSFSSQIAQMAQSAAAAVGVTARQGEVAAAEPGLSLTTLALILAGNGLLAFVLNISSFSSNKHAGALTMTVCGNVKQCLTVLLGIVLFDVKVGLVNGLGMMVALAGAARYSAVELAGKTKAKKQGG